MFHVCFFVSSSTGWPNEFFWSKPYLGYPGNCTTWKQILQPMEVEFEVTFPKKNIFFSEWYPQKLGFLVVFHSYNFQTIIFYISSSMLVSSRKIYAMWLLEIRFIGKSCTRKASPDWLHHQILAPNISQQSGDIQAFLYRWRTKNIFFLKPEMINEYIEITWHWIQIVPFIESVSLKIAQTTNI